MNRLILACLALGLVCAEVRAEGPSKDAVKKLAIEMKDGTLAGDYAVVIDHTYPTIVKEMGGREKAIEQVKSIMESMKNQGFEITRYNVGEPGEFKTEGVNTFVVVPTSLEMKFAAGRVIQKSYLLGVSPDGGKAWTFLDGAGARDKATWARVVPKLPEGFKLPDPAKPEVIRNP